MSEIIYSEIARILREDANHFDLFNEFCDSTISARMRYIATVIEAEQPPELVRQAAVDCRMGRCVNKADKGEHHA